jgi:hypothetical protein
MNKSRQQILAMKLPSVEVINSELLNQLRYNGPESEMILSIAREIWREFQETEMVVLYIDGPVQEYESKSIVWSCHGENPIMIQVTDIIDHLLQTTLRKQ